MTKYEYDAIALKLDHAHTLAVAEYGDDAPLQLIANVIKRKVEPELGTHKLWNTICYVVDAKICARER